MPEFKRYAVYYLPPEGPLARFGAEWLGWDVVGGCPAAPPQEVTVDPRPLTETPRKYGFHATIKPPFRLAEGAEPAALGAAFAAFCAAQPRVTLQALEVARLGRFLALVHAGEVTALNALAAAAVSKLDVYRAPPTAAELARRRQARLSPRQDALLTQWGYPYVMDQFRFHMTLTGKLPKAEAAALEEVLTTHLTPLLPTPFQIDSLSLVGEDAEGLFHEVTRCRLAG